MKKVVAFVHIVDHVNMWIAKVFGFLVIAMAFIFMSGIIMRYVFKQPLMWEGDITWLLFVGFSLLAGAYVLRQDGHVRLDVLYGRLSPKRKAIMDAATFIFFLLFMVILTWFAIMKAWWSVSVMETSALSSFHGPIYPARICLALGSLLLLFQGVAEFTGNIRTITGHKIEGRVE